jgi:hypothetical protein
MIRATHLNTLLCAAPVTRPGLFSGSPGTLMTVGTCQLAARGQSKWHTRSGGHQPQAHKADAICLQTDNWTTPVTRPGLFSGSPGTLMTARRGARAAPSSIDKLGPRYVKRCRAGQGRIANTEFQHSAGVET